MGRAAEQRRVEAAGWLARSLVPAENDHRGLGTTRGHNGMPQRECRSIGRQRCLRRQFAPPAHPSARNSLHAFVVPVVLPG